MDYLPYSELDGKKNIVVDGTPHKDSELVLSHWIDSGTKKEWMRDTSAEIVLDYIEAYQVPDDIKFVSNDHYDQDGLIGIFVLLNPEYALQNKEILIDIAEAGDFGKYKDRKAVRISMALVTMLDPKYNYIDAGVFKKPYPEMASCFYRNGFEMLPKLIEDIESYKDLWLEEDEFLSESEKLIANKEITIEESIENDLAIINIPVDLENKKFHRFTMNKKWPVHDIAIHNATKRGRIFYKHGSRYQFKYRYETWVQLKNNTHPLRVDLKPTVDKLNALDTSNWTYDGSEKLIPALQTVDNSESSLSAGEILEVIKKDLNSSEVNWDPYR